MQTGRVLSARYQWGRALADIYRLSTATKGEGIASSAGNIEFCFCQIYVLDVSFKVEFIRRNNE